MGSVNLSCDVTRIDPMKKPVVNTDIALERRRAYRIASNCVGE